MRDPFVRTGQNATVARDRLRVAPKTRQIQNQCIERATKRQRLKEPLQIRHISFSQSLTAHFFQREFARHDWKNLTLFRRTIRTLAHRVPGAFLLSRLERRDGRRRTLRTRREETVKTTPPHRRTPRGRKRDRTVHARGSRLRDQVLFTSLF